MVACADGHLDDFPWKEWAHGDSATCSDPLELIDTGSSGSASDLVVKCTNCHKQRQLGSAFQKDAINRCTGRRPWLAPTHYEAGCGQSVKTILRGASNAYFSVVSSALSIPPWSDPIHQELASQVPSGAIATAFTLALWPVRVARGVPSSAQSR